MTPILRPDQSKLKYDIYGGWSAGNRNMMAVLPTGGGKSVVMSNIARELYEARLRFPVIAHRNELVSQMSHHLARHDVPHRLLANNETIRQIIASHREEFGMSYVHPTENASVAGIDTINARAETLKEWAAQQDYFMGDEGHHFLRLNKWGRGVSLLTNARGLLVTATAGRPDGQGLGRGELINGVWTNDGIVDGIVFGPEMRWLIDNGALTDYEIVCPASDLHIDDDAITDGGDFSPKKLKAAAEKSRIVGDVVREYSRHALGKRAICFATDVDTANKIAKQFNDAGIRAASVSAKTPSPVREKYIKEFKAGVVKILVNVDLFDEGFDVPACEVVIMARPTASIVKYLQMFGRALRVMAGKDCIARGSMVLTDNGLKPIENISLHDKVWDGCNFVSHDGAVCKGVKNVIEYQGLVATPDHEVWTAQGWRAFGECALEQIPIAKTGFGRIAIRECENLFTDSILERNKTAKNVRFNRMHHMRSKNKNNVYKLNRKKNVRLSKLQSANKISKVVLFSRSTTRTALQQSKRPILSQVWRSRNRIQICFRNGSSTLDKGQFGNSSRPKTAIGSNRKRRTLRTRKHSLVNTFAKQLAYSQKESFRCNEQIQTRFSAHSIRGRNVTWNVFSKYDTRRNCRKMVTPIMQTEREVWDILNCGPLSRFTAQGLLVHNCGLIIDHVSNVVRHGLPDKPRQWGLDRRDKRGKSEKDPEDMPMTRCLNKDVIPACMKPYPRVLSACPHCGWEPPLPEPGSGGRTVEMVDGDLVYLDRAALEAKRKAAVMEDAASVAQRVGAAAGGAAGHFHANKQIAKIQAHGRLKATIEQWAGIQRWLGRSDSQTFRRFYLTTGIDVLEALNAERSRDDFEKMEATVRGWYER